MNDHVMGILARGETYLIEVEQLKRERKSLISSPCLIHAVAFRPLTNQHVPRACGGETEHAGMNV